MTNGEKNKGQIRHKFDIITDACTVCNVIKKNISVVGNGYNFARMPKTKTVYSSDGGQTWSNDYINCTKTKK